MNFGRSHCDQKDQRDPNWAKTVAILKHILTDTTRTISEMSLSRHIWTGWSEKEPEFDLRTWISLCYFQNKKLKYWNKSTKSTEDTLMHTRSVRPIPTKTHFVISSKTKDNIFGFLRKWNWYYLFFWLRLQVSTIVYSIRYVDEVKLGQKG